MPIDELEGEEVLAGAEEEAGPAVFRDELAAVKDQLDALASHELRPVNLDVAAAGMLVLGHLPELRTLRPEMVRWFGEEMASAVDRLEPVARAAIVAEAEHAAFSRGEDIAPLSEAAIEAREQLVCEARALVARKRLAKDALSGLRGSNGYKNQVFDLVQLTTLLERAWPRIAPYTGLRRAELARADSIAAELATAIGARETSGGPTAATRQRVFSLLVHTYDDARRMASFLRWKDGDLDRFAPSLYMARRSRRSGAETTEPTEAPLEPALGTEEPGMPGSNPFPNG